MNSKRKFFLLASAVIAIFALGAFTAFAQDSTTTAQPPFAGMGRGMGIQSHLHWDDDTAPMYAAAADALGIDAQTLIAELQSGKTLAQLAEEKGIDLTAVTEATQATMQLHLDELVAAGVLTQEQAEARLTLMQQRWVSAPMLNGTCCGQATGTAMGMGRGGMSGGSDTAPRGRMGRGG